MFQIKLPRWRMPMTVCPHNHRYSKPQSEIALLCNILGLTCCGIAMVFALWLLFFPTSVAAAPGVTITAITPYAVNDSNKCNVGDGPHAMYLQVNITNSSGGTLTNLQATLGFSTAGFALAGGQSASVYLGTLAPGATTPVFWFVTYPCGDSVVGNYQVTVTDSTPGATTFNGTLTTRNEISANAGGNIYTTSLGPGLYVGQVATYTVVYDFGNSFNGGADVNIQPAGNPTFRADCFQLISDTISSSTFGSGILTGANNRLYFPSVTSGASNNYVTVTYFFRILCTGQSSPVFPFADLTSGKNNQKYTGNYGGVCVSIPCTPTLPAPQNPFQVSKTASSTGVSSGGIVTYTVRVTNTSNIPIMLDAITDTLPSGTGLPATTYNGIVPASFIQSNNSSYVPPVPSVGTIYWLSQPNSTWTVPANDSITLIYQVQFPSSSAVGTYQNTANARVGNTTIGSSAVNVGFNSPTAVKLSSFSAKIATEPNTVALPQGWELGVALILLAGITIYHRRK